jgi:hypothetical protein
MASTLVNLSGFSPGIANDETGINVEQVTITALANKKVEVPNKAGNTRGTWYFDKGKSIEVAGEVTGNIDATIGGTLVVANDETLGGVSSGTIICEEITLTKNREQLEKVAFKAVQKEDQTA